MNENNFVNAIDIAAFIIGVMNMVQNEAQTAYNDVHAANDAQAKVILDEIGKRLDAQDAMLKKILDKLEREA